MKRFAFTSQIPVKLFLFFSFLAFATGISAQATLSVQGVLTKSDGTAVDDGDYSLTFRLWKDASSTNPADKVHQEVIPNVETTGGVYSVVLGTNGTPITAPFDQIYYLGVSVGASSSELLPRPVLTHAPYALSLLGQNNKFPSTGAVTADAFRVRGGAAQGGLGGNGYAFQSATGDENGGMFSNGADNISLYAGGSNRMKLTGTQNELYGPAINYGSFTSNDQTVNGNEVINGNGSAYSFRARGGAPGSGNSNNNGYAFSGNGGDNDSGMFSGADGYLDFYTNGNRVATFNPDGSMGLVFNSNNNSPLFVQPGAGSTGTITMNARIFAPGMLLSGNGGLGVFYDQNSHELTAKTSSRRFKTNIKPFVDDFSLILKAQPKIYTRPESPDPAATEIGYIAEEMDSLNLQQLVIYDKDGNEFSLKYDLVPIYTLEVVKMQDAAIKQLRAELESLKAENTQLQTTNNSLRADNGNMQQQQANFETKLEALSKRMNSLEHSGTENNRK